jgi:hypothetical protein
MIPGFEALVEQRIKRAEKDGEFDNLEGRGQPFVYEEEHVPQELRLAHKILKNAGFLPPELELRKKISRVEQLLDQTGYDSPERSKIQKKLNYLLTKLGTRGSTTSSSGLTNDMNETDKIDEYRGKIIKKIS